MFNIFSKKTPLYFSRSDYYDSIANDNGFIQTLFADVPPGIENSHSTEGSILFNNKITINSSLKMIEAVLGKPSYVLDKSQFVDHKIVFYKKIIGAYRVRFELHLIEDKLFIGFKTFDISTTNDKMKIINSLFKKYELTPFPTDIKLEELKIEDSSGNYIKVLESVNITLAYSSDNKSITETLLNMSNNKEMLEMKKAQNEEKSLLNSI